jgi:hypothetical protein
MKNTLLKTAFAVVLYVLGSALAYSDVLYDDLALSQDGSGNSNNTLGDSFSTGTNTSPLSDVKLVLVANNPSDGGSVQVGLYSDIGTPSTPNPGSLLLNIGSLADSSMASTYAVYDFSLATPYALADNTRYWVEVSSSNGSAEWVYSYSNGGVGVVNEYWFDGGAPQSNSGGPYLMSVTSVPLPASALMFAAGLLGFGVSRKKIQAA